MIDLNYTWVDMECPNCGYEDIIQLIDMKTEKNVFCHNCKANIKLLDDHASVYSGIESINATINKLKNALNR